MQFDVKEPQEGKKFNLGQLETALKLKNKTEFIIEGYPRQRNYNIQWPGDMTST